MSDNLYLGIYRFSGVPYHRWIYTANKLSAVFAAKGIAARRNADVPTERTELVSVFEIGTEISKERADQYVEQMREQRAKKGNPQPEDIDRKAPDRMLYQPVTASGIVAMPGRALWPANFRL